MLDEELLLFAVLLLLLLNQEEVEDDSFSGRYKCCEKDLCSRPSSEEAVTESPAIVT